jgi:hypothetical protein
MTRKQIAATLGLAAGGVMIVVNVATNDSHFGDAVYAQPVSHMGATETWAPPVTTTPPAAPVTEKAYPEVKAPHR